MLDLRALAVAHDAAPALGGAAPFRFSGSAESLANALQCLSTAVYYEAGNQSEAGARAVGSRRDGR